MLKHACFILAILLFATAACSPVVTTPTQTEANAAMPAVTGATRAAILRIIDPFIKFERPSGEGVLVVEYGPEGWLVNGKPTVTDDVKKLLPTAPGQVYMACSTTKDLRERLKADKKYWGGTHMKFNAKDGVSCVTAYNDKAALQKHMKDQKSDAAGEQIDDMIRRYENYSSMVVDALPEDKPLYVDGFGFFGLVFDTKQNFVGWSDCKNPALTGGKLEYEPIDFAVHPSE